MAVTDPQFHDYDLTFSVQTEVPHETVPAADLRTALTSWVNSLSDGQLLAACRWSGTYNQSDLEDCTAP